MNKNLIGFAAFALVFSSVVFGMAFPAHAQLSDGFSLYDREAPNLDAQYITAMALSNNGDYDAAAQAIAPLASAGHLDAQYQLAVLHFEGKSVTMTDAQAVAVTRRAAESDHYEAQELMTLLVINGFHKLVTHEEANIYHEKLAHKGRAGSQHTMGRRAYNAKDYGMARFWLEKAAAQGYELSRKSLAELNAKTAAKTQPQSLPDFPVFVDSPLNALGDAAASCSWVISEALETDRAGGNSAATLDIIRRVLINPDHNGGFDEIAVNDALSLHILAATAKAQSNSIMTAMLGAQTGPSLKYCENNFFSFMNAFITANAKSK